jgi:tetratricopeptide (TPR) repeat protein
MGGSTFRSIRFGLVLLSLGLSPDPAAADDFKVCGDASGDEAISACSRAIVSNRFTGNDLAKLLTNRGVELKRQGKLDAAIADYNGAIVLNPKDMFSFNNRGNALRDRGDLQAAIADYTEAIRLDPDYAAAYVNRGRVHESQNNQDGARADFTAVLSTSDKYGNSRGAKDLARGRLKALEKK